MTLPPANPRSAGSSVIATSSYGQKHDVQPDDSSPTGCSFTCQYGYASPVSYIPGIQFSDLTGELRFSSKFQGPFQIVAGALACRAS